MVASTTCSTTADAASQTEPAHAPRKGAVSSLVRESPIALRLASQCQTAKGVPSVRVAARVLVEQVQQPCPLADTMESTRTPRTDVSSDTSLATAAGPVELPRFAGKWTPTLDLETQRIARIMRGSSACMEESDTSSNSCD